MISRMNGPRITFRITGDGPEELQVGAAVELLMSVKNAAFRIRAQIEWREGPELVAFVNPTTASNGGPGKLELPVQFRAARSNGFAGLYRSGLATELDPDGICIRVDNAAGISGKFQVAFAFCEEEDSGGTSRVYGDDGSAIKQGMPGPVKATTEVVDVRPEPAGGFLVTMRFVSITPTDRASIATFLSRAA
jgi:hypothetical protein